MLSGAGVIPGGCPLLNTAIDTDDGNAVLRERARKALRGWRSYVISMISAGIKAREIRPRIDAKKLATLIISSLEGAIMVYRLERNEEALRVIQGHLNSYLETEVRVGPASGLFGGADRKQTGDDFATVKTATGSASKKGSKI